MVEPNTKLHKIAGEGILRVNSFHREAIVKVSDDVVVNAKSSDGLIEGIEYPSRKFALGVQWHPERLIEETADARALFAAFVGACDTMKT